MTASRSPSSSRLLLLSYHFPPSAAAGALRWEKLAGFAAQRGYGLDVVSLEAPADTLPGIPAGTRVIGVPSAIHWSRRLEERTWSLLRGRRSLHDTAPAPVAHAGGREARPSSLAAEEIRWSIAPRALLRAWWSWGGWAQDRAWAARAARAASGILDPSVHRAIITCGPPHMVHRAGGRLAQRAGIPHVMDLRDPWAIPRRQPEELASPVTFALAARSESRAVAGASLIVANTNPLRDAMRARYPGMNERIITVMNGYDDEVLPAPNRSDRRFTVTYAGALYLDRDPGVFLRAAGRLVTERGLSPEEFGVAFLGSGDNFAGVPLRRIAAEAGLEGHLEILPRVPRTDALRVLAGSTVLLNLPQDSAFAIPSKVFEYLLFPVWILALASPGSPTADVLKGTSADVVPPDDLEGIRGTLERHYEEFRRGIHPGPIRGREHLSRAHQAQLFFDALERLR